MDYQIQFGKNGFAFQAAFTRECVISVPKQKSVVSTHSPPPWPCYGGFFMVVYKAALFAAWALYCFLLQCKPDGWRRGMVDFAH